MYKTLVLSHFDYCDVIYHIPSKQDQFGGIINSLMEKAERIQSLSDRRWCRRQIHKIVNNTPCCHINKLPSYRRPLYSRNNTNTFQGIRCKSDRYMNSFFPDGINSWNNVIEHFKNIPTIDDLKNHILYLIRPPKKSIFGIHDPLAGLGFLFQLTQKTPQLR